MKLALENLSFGYPGRVVGRDVSFAMDGGEVLCVLGPNGGGKTTLFRTLLGLLHPLGGRAVLDGVAVDARSRTEMARLAGYVPQAHAGYFPFTVREIVLMGRTAHLGLFATPSSRDRAIADKALATLGIDHLGDRTYTRISGGERQLTLIARALAQESRLLVMDEPTANLDFGNQVRVLDRIKALAADGIAILFSTHDPDHAFLCADRVALLHDGRVDPLGPPRATITPDSLRRLYGVEVRIAEIEPEKRLVCVPSLAR
jgi:iron complex transport system ATP-binding protein